MKIFYQLNENKMNLKSKLKKYPFKLSLLYIIVFFVIFSCNSSNTTQRNKAITSIEKYRQLRSEKLNLPRPVIHNNDGCDAYLYPLKFKKNYSKK